MKLHSCRRKRLWTFWAPTYFSVFSYNYETYLMQSNSLSQSWELQRRLLGAIWAKRSIFMLICDLGAGRGMSVFLKVQDKAPDRPQASSFLTLISFSACCFVQNIITLIKNSSLFIWLFKNEWCMKILVQCKTRTPKIVFLVVLTCTCGIFLGKLRLKCLYSKYCKLGANNKTL